MRIAAPAAPAWTEPGTGVSRTGTGLSDRGGSTGAGVDTGGILAVGRQGRTGCGVGDATLGGAAGGGACCVNYCCLDVCEAGSGSVDEDFGPLRAVGLRFETVEDSGFGAEVEER